MGSAPKTGLAAAAVILGLVSGVGPFAVNTYFPAFDEMGRNLLADPVMMQVTLTLYLVGFAASSLFMGGISDALGRKRVLFWGLAGFAAANFLTAFALDYGALCLLRLIQGLCAGVSQVVTQAVVRDRFSGLAATRLNSLIAVVFQIAPAAAPVIGGYIVIFLNWEGVFFFLAAYGLLCCAIVKGFLPETLPKERRAQLNARDFLKSYRRVLTSPAFMFGVFANGAFFSGAILYTAASADIVLHIFRMGPEDFAAFCLPLVFSAVAGALLCAPLVKRFGGKKVIAATFAAAIIIGAGTALTDMALHLAYPWAMAGALLFRSAAGIIQPEMSTMNLDYFPRERGCAASVQQCLQSLSFAVSTGVLVPLGMGSMLSYVLISAACAALGCALWGASLHFRGKALASSGVPEEHFWHAGR